MREELRNLGSEICCVGLRDDCDVVLPIVEYNLQRILSSVPFNPDLIVYMDSIERVIPAGLEDSPCPLVAFFVDSTINSFWQHPFAQIFDLVLTDQKPDAEILQQNGVNAHWFPLAADTEIYKPSNQHKKYDISFVGSRNPSTRTKRENILSLLENHFDINIFSGDPFLSPLETASVYNQSHIVLNENLFPSVNLRLFETMACGTVVLTEENDIGLRDLFIDQKHILTYNSDNLIEKTSEFLNKIFKLEQISQRSAQLIAEKHSMEKRATQLMELIEATPAKERNELTIGKKKSLLGQAFLYYSLKWQEKDHFALTKSKQYLDEAIRIDPDAYSLLTLGLLHTLIGDDLIAQTCFEGVSKIDTRNFRAHLYNAIILQKSGRKEQAVEASRKAQKLAGIDSADETSLIPFTEAFHVCWGNHFRYSGEAFSAGLMRFDLPVQFWTGLEYLKKAADLNPKYWEDVGDLLMEHNIPEKALEAYQQLGSGVDAVKIIETRRKAYLQ